MVLLPINPVARCRASSTPRGQPAGNDTGYRLNAKAPDRPKRAADAIVRLVERPRDKVSVGAVGKLTPLADAVVAGAGSPWPWRRRL